MERISRTRRVVDLLAGRTSVAEAALDEGVTEDEILAWKALYLAGATHATDATTPTRPSRRVATSFVSVATAIGLVGFLGRAYSQDAACAQTLPAPLTTFCAGAPARASEVNGNFQQIVTWIEGKVGAVSSMGVSAPSVTTPTVDATTVTAQTVATGGLSATRLASLAITPPYASWDSQGTGDGGAAIYNDASNFRTLMIVGNSSGGGGRRRIGMWDDVSVNGELSASRLRGPLGRSSCTWRLAQASNSTGGPDAGDWYQPNGSWATYNTNDRYHIAVCADGEYMAGYAVYATGQIDGNGRVLCCTP